MPRVHCRSGMPANTDHFQLTLCSPLVLSVRALPRGRITWYIAVASAALPASV